MKFVIVFALFALAAARPNRPELPKPPTDKLELIREKLQELLNLSRPPIHIGAEPVDIYEPVHIGPALVDFDPIRPPPGPVDKETIRDLLRRLRDLIINKRPQPIHVGAEPVDVPVSADPTPASSPLVQIIVNVQGSESGSASPVVVEGLDHPSPVHVVETVDESEILPTPVNVIEDHY